MGIQYFLINKLMFKQGQEFYLINGVALDKHEVAGSFIDKGETTYIFIPQGQVHTIKETEMYATVKEATEKRVIRLKESAKVNLDQAEIVEKDGMTVNDFTPAAIKKAAEIAAKAKTKEKPELEAGQEAKKQ